MADEIVVHAAGPLHHRAAEALGRRPQHLGCVARGMVETRRVVVVLVDLQEGGVQREHVKYTSQTSVFFRCLHQQQHRPTWPGSYLRYTAQNLLPAGRTPHACMHSARPPRTAWLLAFLCSARCSSPTTTSCAATAAELLMRVPHLGVPCVGDVRPRLVASREVLPGAAVVKLAGACEVCRPLLGAGLEGGRPCQRRGVMAGADRVV